MGRESKTSLRRGEFIRAKGGGAWVRAEGGGQGQGGRCGPGWAEVVVRHSSHDHQDGARPTPALLLLLLTLLLLPVSPAGPSVSDAAHVLTSESLLFPFRFCVCVYLFLLLYLLLLLPPPTSVSSAATPSTPATDSPAATPPSLGVARLSQLRRHASSCSCF